MRAVLILNPTSGISNLSSSTTSPEEHEQQILERLRSYDIEPEVLHTTPEDAGEGLAKQAAQDQAELVIVAGGDGTIHAVAAGLVGTQTVLGILPQGTMNNLAHSLNIPADIDAACAVIGKGETQAIDVGKINSHYFIEVAGIGLDAALFPAAEEMKSRGFLSSLNGAIKGLKTLLAYRPTRLRIALDQGERHSYHAMQVTICNSPYYGMHMLAAPEATMNDGLLDVIIYRNFSKLEYIRHAISISRGQRTIQPKIKRRQVKSLRISAKMPLQVQADGQPLGYTPVTVAVLPGALRVRTPGVNAPGLLNEREGEFLITT